jgi:hypothetical protein
MEEGEKDEEKVQKVIVFVVEVGSGGGRGGESVVTNMASDGHVARKKDCPFHLLPSPSSDA